MDSLVDLRSDTLTAPTPDMRRAMAAAEVGDDVYGEDPTVNALEAAVAEIFGHEAALFVPSGTMSNLICAQLLVGPGEELLCDADAHVVTYELGGLARLGGIQTRTFTGVRGLPVVADVIGQLRSSQWGPVHTRAVAVEQTHNRGGGRVLPYPFLESLRAATTEAGVALHCDGARIWNAMVATETSGEQYGQLFDTLSVCLSKGLGAPVGSLVIGSADRVGQARLLRKRLGGGMRQAGILAAAGLHAVRHHVGRLVDDHVRAKRLAEMVGVDPAVVDTNIVPMSVPDARALAGSARTEGVLVSVVGPQRIRLVTHLDVDDAGVEHAGTVIRRLLAG